MPEAFETPYEDPFGEEVEEPEVEEKPEPPKSRKLLYVLGLVLLGSAIFTFYPKEKQPIQSSTKSQDEPAALIPESLQPESPAGKHVEVIPESLPPKEGALEYSYKKDKEYLAINRYERPSLEPRISTRPTERVRDTVAVVDKPLALAGRGFEIEKFQPPSATGVEVDYLQHLKKAVPKMERLTPDTLDLQLQQAKSSKDLIFHPLRPALSQIPSPPKWQDPESSGMKSPTLERVPETKLLFKPGEDSTLVLRPGKEPMDLLIGNERINRKKYEDW